MGTGEVKGRRSVDLGAIRALGDRPRRRGCLGTTLLLCVLPLSLCALSGYSVTSMELAAAERSCLGTPVGMSRSDAEARLARELDARSLGSGGPSGGPVTAIEMGRRGEVVSWSCQILLDENGDASRAHFHSWTVPALRGHRSPTIPGLPGMGELPLPIPSLPSRAPSSIPDLDDPDLPPEIRDALSPD